MSWLPLHPVLFNLLFDVTGSHVTTSHVANSIFAGTALFFALAIAFEFSSTVKASCVCALLFLTSPMWLWISISMLSEPLFCALTAGFAFCLLKYIRTPNQPLLCAVVVLYLLMALTRFEAWPIGIALSYTLIRDRRSWVRILCATVPALIPILWISVSAWVQDDPFFFFHWYTSDSKAFFKQAGNHAAWPNGLVLRGFATHFPASLLLTCIVAFYPRFKNKGVRIFAIAILLQTIISIAMVWNRVPTVFPERVAIIPGLMSFCLLSIILWDTDHRGLKSFCRLAVVAQILVNVSLMFHFDPRNYSKSMHQTITRLWNAPSFRAHAAKGPIMCQGDSTLCTMTAVVSETPNAVSGLMTFDERRNTFRLHPSISKAPKVYLFESNEIANLLLGQWSKAKRVDMGPFILVTNDLKLIEEVSAL